MSQYEWRRRVATCTLSPPLCVSIAGTQLPAECRWTSNVCGPHLSPLLSEDRRSYTLEQCDTKHTHTGTQYCPASDTAALVCFGNDSLGISHRDFFLSVAVAVGWLHLQLAFPKNSAKICVFPFIQIDKKKKRLLKKSFTNKMRKKLNSF